MGRNSNQVLLFFSDVANNSLRMFTIPLMIPIHLIQTDYGQSFVSPHVSIDSIPTYNELFS